MRTAESPMFLLCAAPGSYDEVVVETEPSVKVVLMVCDAPLIGREPDTVALVLIATTWRATTWPESAPPASVWMLPATVKFCEAPAASVKPSRFAWWLELSVLAVPVWRPFWSKSTMPLKLASTPRPTRWTVRLLTVTAAELLFVTVKVVNGTREALTTASELTGCAPELTVIWPPVVPVPVPVPVTVPPQTAAIAARVAGPTMPMALTPLADWNLTTAALVRPPKYVDSLPGEPAPADATCVVALPLRNTWRALTSAPSLPCWRERERAGQAPPVPDPPVPGVAWPLRAAVTFAIVAASAPKDARSEVIDWICVCVRPAACAGAIATAPIRARATATPVTRATNRSELLVIVIPIIISN